MLHIKQLSVDHCATPNFLKCLASEKVEFLLLFDVRVLIRFTKALIQKMTKGLSLSWPKFHWNSIRQQQADVYQLSTIYNTQIWWNYFKYIKMKKMNWIEKNVPLFSLYCDCLPILQISTPRAYKIHNTLASYALISHYTWISYKSAFMHNIVKAKIASREFLSTGIGSIMKEFSKSYESSSRAIRLSLMLFVCFKWHTDISI